VSDGYICPECGLDYDKVAPGDIAVAVRSFPRRFRAALASVDDQDAPEAIIRRKPAPEVWSALTYTSHVADVFDMLGSSIRQLLEKDDPVVQFAPGAGHTDEAAADAQEKDAVLDRLKAEGEKLAALLDGVKAEAWSRTGEFPWGTRDVLTTARNAVHEGHHHLRDVEHVLAQVRA
jgi:hypothetical protein